MRHEHKAQRTVVCLLVRRYEALSSFQPLRVLAPNAALGCSVLFAFIYANTSYSSPSGLCGISEYWRHLPPWVVLLFSLFFDLC